VLYEIVKLNKMKEIKKIDISADVIQTKSGLYFGRVRIDEQYYETDRCKYRGDVDIKIK
jgi:hypothetical protein